MVVVTGQTGDGIMLDALMLDEYDVFLSYSSVDKPALEAVAVRLRDEARLRPFLDKWHLVPGESWMPSLKQALGRSTTIAVFFGPQGRGAWQDQEAQLALVLYQHRKKAPARTDASQALGAAQCSSTPP